MGVALMLLFVMVQDAPRDHHRYFGHIVFNIPLVTIMIRRGCANSIRPCARRGRSGADAWQVSDTLPFRSCARPSGAVLVAFTVSPDDFLVTFLPRVPATTPPLKVYSMIKSGVTPRNQCALSACCWWSRWVSPLPAPSAASRGLSGDATIPEVFSGMGLVWLLGRLSCWAAVSVGRVRRDSTGPALLYLVGLRGPGPHSGVRNDGSR